MAQLKDSLITGDLRVTGTIYGNIPLKDLVDADDLKAIEALTGTSGWLKKTAANTWALGTFAASDIPNIDASKITSGTLPIARGGTGLAASPSMLTNLESTTAANVLQASPRPGITGTLGITHGGTGATTATNAVNNLLSGAPAWTAVPTDSTYFIRQDTGGANSFGRAPFSTVWTYIKGKADSVYATSGHNHDSTYVNVSGDTMTGALTLSGAPTANLHAATKQYVDQSFAANDAMIFKGTIGTGGTVTTLPNTHNVGWTYRVIEAKQYAGIQCEVGDLIICITDGTTANNAHWTVAQTNIDGAVVGPASATDGNFALFNGTTGKLIKNSSYSPSSFAAASHTHGNITNDGTLGTASRAVVTDANKKITVADLTVASPTAATTTSTTFIDTVSQVANGKISATKKTLPTASTSVAGIIKIGTTATDAAAGNHNHDSVYLKKAGDTATGLLTLQQGSVIHSANAEGGVNTIGYAKICQIIVGSAYRNTPIEIAFARRSDLAVTRLYITFSNQNTTDPTLAKFGWIGHTGQAFIHKSATSTWDVYVQKTERYDTICVVDYHKPQQMTSVTLTWTNEWVNTLPTDAIQAESVGTIKTAEFAASATTATVAASADALNYVNSNEILMGNANISDGSIHINHRRIKGGASSGNNAITNYYFKNGNGEVTGVTIHAGAFKGSGASLTNLDGSNITSGTVPIARIPTGTSATTVALGNHTHTTSIATSTGTNALSMAYGTKYAITAGGTSYIFTTPALGTSATTAAAGNHTHSYLPLSGGTVTGTLVLSKTTDLSGTANNSPALIVGGAATAAHLEFDANEIQAKTNETSVAPLYINNDGGIVTFGDTNDATSSTNGAVKVSGGLAVNKRAWIGGSITAASATNKTSQLIVSSNDTGAGNQASIELWRGTSASWQLANNGGNLYFKTNWVSGLKTTYELTALQLNHSTGNAIFKNDVSATTFTGSGANLTNLNASNLSSGTVPIARIPTGTSNTTVALGNHTHNYAGSSSAGGAATTVTTAQDNTNALYLTGVTSSATTALKYNTNFALAGTSFYPASGVNASLGTLANPWQTVAIHHQLNIIGKAGDASVSARIADSTGNPYWYACTDTLGTTTVEGIGRMNLGNAVAKGTAGNATGLLRMYGSEGDYSYIQYNSTTESLDFMFA